MIWGTMIIIVIEIFVVVIFAIFMRVILFFFVFATFYSCLIDDD